MHIWSVKCFKSVAKKTEQLMSAVSFLLKLNPCREQVF